MDKTFHAQMTILCVLPVTCMCYVADMMLKDSTAVGCSYRIDLVCHLMFEDGG